ncbi:MAG: DUF5937 family protein [Gaiellaceae bacterium]
MITLVADRPSDVLGVRVATSPAWETVLAARTHAHGRARTMQRVWADTIAGAAAGIDLEPLLAVNPRAGFVPDFLTPPPRAVAPRLREQLAEVRATPAAQVESELRRCRAGLTDREQLRILDTFLADPAAARDALAGLIETAWDVLVRPFWPRIRALLTADIGHRAQLLVEHGLRRVVDDLDDRIAWAGSAITIEARDDLTVDLDERGVVLMPSAFVWPVVVAITDSPWQPTIVYPARGIAELWQRPPGAPDALARLLGGTRAAILVALDAPASTTALAARLDLSPSGASRHLTTLRDAGLVTGARHRHEVRYSRTRLATALIRAAAVTTA